MRKYKGTKRPPTISSFIWQSMSQKQSREAKQKYEKDKLVESMPSATDRPASSKERKAAVAGAKEQRRSEGLAGLSVKQLTDPEHRLLIVINNFSLLLKRSFFNIL